MKVTDPRFQLERIRKYIDEDIFPTRIRASDYDDSSWSDFRLGDRWGGYDRVAWFRTVVRIPEEFRGQQIVFRAIVGPRDGGASADYEAV